MTAPVLVTGFAPFRHYAVNSSWEAARLLPGMARGVEARLLPVDHHGAAARLRVLVAELRPRALLLPGLAAGAALRLETLARRPAGFTGPDLRPGRWPFARARAAMAHAAPARLSRDAGAYVCETAYWAALGLPVPRVAFLHVPPLSPSPGGAWEARRLARAMRACLSAL